MELDNSRENEPESQPEGVLHQTVETILQTGGS